MGRGGKSIRRVVITKDKNGFSGSVLVIITTREYGTKNIFFRASDFSGVAGRFDLNMKFQYGYYYEHGKSKYNADFESFASRQVYERTAQTERECRFLQDSYVDAEGVFTVYGYSVCQDSDPPTTGGGVTPPWEGGIGGGGGGGTGTGNGGGGRGNLEEHEEMDKPADPLPRSVQTLRSELKSPCLKSALEKALNAGLQNKIATVINTVFNTSPDINLTFVEKSTKELPQGDVTYLGYTDVEHAVRNYGEKNGLLVINYAEIEIQLNRDVLPGMPEELIGVVILHEALHAYISLMDAQNRIAYQHEVMAAVMRNKIMDALTEMYPNMPIEDKTALSWSGLTDTFQWDLNKLRSYRGNDLTAINAKNTLGKYESRQAGTPSKCL